MEIALRCKMGEFDGWYKYVRYTEISAWEAKGWMLADCEIPPCHHNDYSVIMKWVGEGDPSVG